MVRTTAMSLLTTCLLFGLGCAAPAAIADEHQTRRITVTGSAEMRAVPDLARLSIGVETEAKTPGEALAENAVRMTFQMSTCLTSSCCRRPRRQSSIRCAADRSTAVAVSTGLAQA